MGSQSAVCAAAGNARPAWHVPGNTAVILSDRLVEFDADPVACLKLQGCCAPAQHVRSGQVQIAEHVAPRLLG